MNIPSYELVCYGCGGAYPAGHALTCPACGEPLSILLLSMPCREVFDRIPVSMWDYFDFLPVESRESIVTLGEGATPLIELQRLSRDLGFTELWVKNEMVNPTGSFKDRQVSVGISHAREVGADTVAVVSSGNVACAAAAYAARAGMQAVLLMHGHAAGGKVVVASMFGGHTVRVDTPSANRTFDLCIEACERFGWYHLSTAGMYNPFNVEGAKTIAYELYIQMGRDLPEWIVAPVGGGGLLGSVWRGFLDLRRIGLIDEIPRLAGVQAAGCAPLKKAVDLGTRYLDTLNDPWLNPKTIAGGIADDILFDGHTVLPAIRTTEGVALAVDDMEILAAQRRLAETEGLLCEPTAAVVIAALPHIAEAAAGTRVCCILTGNGTKDIETLQGLVPEARTIAPDLDALARLVG